MEETLGQGQEEVKGAAENKWEGQERWAGCTSPGEPRGETVSRKRSKSVGRTKERTQAGERWWGCQGRRARVGYMQRQSKEAKTE